MRCYLLDGKRLNEAAEKITTECKACGRRLKGARDILHHLLACQHIPAGERRSLLDWLVQISRLPDDAFERWLSEPGNFKFLLREGIVRPVGDATGRA